QYVRPDGEIAERKPAERLPSNAVTVLYVYGHLFYAGAAILNRQLPRPNGAQNPVVVLRLRGQPNVGATLADVLSRYGDELHKRNGRLYVTGLNRRTFKQLVEEGKLRLSGPVRAYQLTPVIGESRSEEHTSELQSREK